MATLLERVGALLSANLNWVVDRAMQASSPAMLDDYIRKLQDHLYALEDACATVGGNAKTLQRKAEQFQGLADSKDTAVDQLLRAGRDSLAEAALSQAKVNKRTADTYRGQAAAMSSQYDQLMAARTKLQAKIELAKQERAELLSLLDLAKAKDINLRAVKSVGDLRQLGDPDINRIADSIRARLDKSEAALEVHAKDLDNQMTDFLGQERDRAELEARKRKLGLIQ